MQEKRQGEEVESEGRTAGEGATRLQQGGEAATTRFGMDEGDNTDVPATGGPDSEVQDES